MFFKTFVLIFFAVSAVYTAPPQESAQPPEFGVPSYRPSRQNNFNKNVAKSSAKFELINPLNVLTAGPAAFESLAKVAVQLSEIDKRQKNPKGPGYDISQIEPLIYSLVGKKAEISQVPGFKSISKVLLTWLETAANTNLLRTKFAFRNQQVPRAEVEADEKAKVLISKALQAFKQNGQ